MANDIQSLGREQLLQIAKKKQEREQLLEMAKAKLEMEQSNQPPQVEPKIGQAAIEGFGQSASGGFLPQLQAGVAKGIDKLTPKSQVDLELEKKGFIIKQPEQSYVDVRDKFIERGEKLQEQAPVAYGAGLLGGAVASAPAMGKVVPGAMAATLPGRVGQAALGGGIIGALQNPGDVKGQVNPLQIPERLQGAAVGALAGSAAEGAFTGVRKVVGGATKFAQEKAFKASGAMLKDFRKAFGKGKVEELGQLMIDKGLIRPGYTFDDVANASNALKKEAGTEIGSIYDKVKQDILGNPAALKQKLGFIEPNIFESELRTAAREGRPKIGTSKYDSQMTEVIDDVLGKARAKEIVDARIAKNPELVALQQRAAKDPEAKTIFDTLYHELMSRTQHSNLADVRNLNDIIGEIDSRINWAKRLPEMSDLQHGLVKMRSLLRDKVNQVGDAISGNLGNKPVSSRLKELNKIYGGATEVNRIAADRVARESANRIFSPSDYGVAGVGAIVGGAQGDSFEGKVKGALFGASAGLANKVARQYGNPALAIGASKIGKAAPAVNKMKPGLLGAASANLKGRLDKKDAK